MQADDVKRIELVCRVCGEMDVQEPGWSLTYCAGSRLEGTQHDRTPMVRVAELQFEGAVRAALRDISGPELEEILISVLAEDW